MDYEIIDYSLASLPAPPRMFTAVFAHHSVTASISPTRYEQLKITLSTDRLRPIYTLPLKCPSYELPNNNS